MEKLTKPILKLERDIGDAVIQFEDASLHLFIPEEHHFLELPNEELTNFINDVQELLGTIEKEEKESKLDNKDSWPYTVDSTLYSGSKFKINHIQDELYVGASGGTEQLIIEILATGFASGIAAELTRRLINLIFGTSERSNYSFKDNEIYKNIKRALYKHYGAAGEITFLEKIETETEIHLKAEDFRGKLYEIHINLESGIPSILIQNSR